MMEIIERLGMNDFITTLFAISVVSASVVVLIKSSNRIIETLSSKVNESDNSDITKSIKEFSDLISKNEQVDIINIMYENVGEMREYYVISKQQANRSFVAALFICFAGVIIYVIGMFSYIFGGKDINVITIVSGTVIEVISGLFFWLYKNTIKQLEVYHKRLESTEKYLIAYHMIQQVPEERRYEEQRNYINYVLNDNQCQIKKEKEDY